MAPLCPHSEPAQLDVLLGERTARVREDIEGESVVVLRLHVLSMPSNSFSIWTPWHRRSTLDEISKASIAAVPRESLQNPGGEQTPQTPRCLGDEVNQSSAVAP